VRGKGTKLGEGERDQEGERDFAQMSFAQMSLRANVASRKCRFAQMSLNLCVCVCVCVCI